MNDIFCIAPFVNFSTTTDGHARLCCQAKTYQNLSVVDNSIQNIWNSVEYNQARQKFLNNEWPSECLVCMNNESRGIPSRRYFENNRWSHISKDKILSNPKIYCYDLRMGHTCNLTCIMCTPINSSLWVNEAENYEHLKNHKTHSGHKWATNTELLNEIKNNISTVELLYFAGGEPLLIKKHHELIKYCVDNDYAKNISLIYDTNGTQINQNWIDLWKNFKKVTIQFSIDGGKEVVEYVRYPVKYDILIQSLEILKNSKCSVYLQMALGAYNIFEIAKIQNLAKEYNCDGINISIVDWPEFLSIDNLTDDIKIKVKKLYNDSNIKRVKSLVDNIKINNNNSDKMIEYFEKIDNIRGLDHKKVFTWL